jgi:peptidoglycan/LPS O-acetylase OafA/YrhL
LKLLDTSAPRQPGLDVMRALAILWVMLFHFRIGLPHLLYWPSRYGWMGVDLFFVLSGYLIGSQLLRPYLKGAEPSLAQFYFRRAFRILPAFLAVLGLYVFAPAFREAPGLSPLWQFLTFTENFRIDYLHDQAFSHVWSLCVEEHFYLVLPLLVLVLMRKPRFSKALAVVLSILVFGIVARGWIYLHQLKPLLLAGDNEFYLRYTEWIYYPTYTRLDGLLVGVVLAVIKTFRPLWWQQMMGRGWALLFAGISVCALAMWLFFDRFGLSATLVGFPLMSLGLGLLVAASVSPTCSLSKVRGFGLIATLAYSVYLTHKEIAHLNRMYLGSYMQNGGWPAFLIVFSTCFLAAAVLYFAIERPFLRLRERLQKRKNVAVMESAAAI